MLMVSFLDFIWFWGDRNHRRCRW